MTTQQETYEDKKNRLTNSRFSNYKPYRYNHKIGYDVFCTRRRYPGTTFTWCHVLMPDLSLLDLGDPWPCVTPKQLEVLAAIKLALVNSITEES